MVFTGELVSDTPKWKQKTVRKGVTKPENQGSSLPFSKNTAQCRCRDAESGKFLCDKGKDRESISLTFSSIIKAPTCRFALKNNSY